MSPLLLLTGLTLAAATALLTVYTLTAATARTRVVRARIASGNVGLSFNPGTVLRRERASRFPSRCHAAGLAGGPRTYEPGAGTGRMGYPGWRVFILALCFRLYCRPQWRFPGSLFSYGCIAATRGRSDRSVLQWLAPSPSVPLPQATAAAGADRKAASGCADHDGKVAPGGYRAPSGLAYAANETPPPLGPELQSALRDLQLGAEAEDVFGALSERIGRPDLDIAVTAIVIQRTVGGNLAEILTKVTETIRERAKLYGEVRVLTAQQRLTGNLVALIPLLVALGFFAFKPELGKLLIETTAGQIALAIGIAFELVDLWLIRRLAVIEV